MAIFVNDYISPCCCDPPPGPTPSFARSNCTKCPVGMSACWELVVAGLVNGPCPDCVNRNGTWILRYDASDPSCDHSTNALCVFLTPETDTFFQRDISGPGCATAPFTCCVWTLRWFATGHWQLTSYGLTYRIAEANWDCNGPNTLSLFQNSLCSSVPATLTVEPIVCP